MWALLPSRHIIPYSRKFWRKIFWRIAENMSFGGIYSGGWASSSHNIIFTTKWLIKCAENLTRPWASFCSVRTKSMMKCNWKADRQIVVTLNLDCFRRVGLYSDCVHVVWIAFLALTDNSTLLPPSVYNFLEKRTQLSMVNSTPTILDWHI